MSVVAANPDWATAGVLAFVPPRTLPHADELPLGASVEYSHRAAVARWKPGERHADTGSWWLTEGVVKDERPRIWAKEPEEDRGGVFAWTPDDGFYYRQPTNRINKSVFVWPERGAGVMFGLVRRGVGESYRASGGSGSMFDSFEPGGFDPVGYVHLYAVKLTLSGLGYVLVPHWAAACR